MIYVTGDIHGNPKILKSRLRKIRKRDFLIVCGDFGFIWDGSRKEQKLLSKFSKSNILFVDGTYENFSLLNDYPVSDFFGAEAATVCGNIVHLLRGRCYDFAGTKIFTFGGGIADIERIECGHGESEACPDESQYKFGAKTLNENDLTVDYIITHEAPALIRDTLLDERGAGINEYFSEIMKNAEYKAWYFGCYHIDRSISKNKYNAIYSRVLPLAGTEKFDAKLLKKIEKEKLKNEKD